MKNRMDELVDIPNIVSQLALDGWSDPDELKDKAEFILLGELQKRSSLSPVDLPVEEFDGLVQKVVKKAQDKHGSVNKRKELRGEREEI